MAFEGSEHIYNIISEIKDLIDIVIIGSQHFSYHKTPINNTDKHIIESLYTDKLCDFIYWFDLDSSKDPREQETDKRNKLIQIAQDKGASHVLVIDADEFYNHDTFLQALYKIDENDYDMTYCQYINYYKDYMHYLKYPFKNGMYVPFISKSSYRFSFNSTNIRLASDPTRRYIRKSDNNGEFTDSLYVFEWNELKMHHLSWIRNNIHNKLVSWSSRQLFNNINDLIDLALYDFYHFDDNTQKVHLIFNTPGNTVEICKFDKQYIHPKRNISYYNIKPSEKKILILNMSSSESGGLYETLEQACRDTWAKDILKGVYNNIVYYSVIDTKGETKIDNIQHKIYVHIDDDENNISHLTYRFQIACELVQETFKYEYVVKTNTSTWLNIKAINELLADNYNDTHIFGFKLEQAFWSTFNLYLKGNFTIFSKRTLSILFSIINPKTITTYPDIADDNLIGSCLSNRLTALDIPQTEHLYVLPCKMLTSNNLSIDYNIIDNYAVQVKTLNGNRKYSDVQKMAIINDLYKNNVSHYKKLKDILNQNIVISQIPYIKSDWLNKTDKEKGNIIYQTNDIIYQTWEDCKKDMIQLKRKGGYLK